MAAEPETHQLPPEPPAVATPSAEEKTLAETAQPTAENAAPSKLAPKRQRRPSVRLGEIGDQQAAKLNLESNPRRPNMPPWSWRATPKEASRTSKARSLTNLANGGEEIAEFGNRRGKAKRGSTTKRLRSNFAPKTVTTGTDNNDGHEALKDFDHDHNQNQDHSPVHSVHDGGYWHIGRHLDRARVSENDVAESDSREGRKCEGVRSWLFELGLSRYAPMFEIHEVDDDLLPMLTLEDLKDMGISAVGSRRKMYTAIQKLRKEFP